MDEKLGRGAGVGHVGMQVMARVLSGRAQGEELCQQLLPHIVGQCPECGRLLAQLDRMRREAAAPDALIAAAEWPAAPLLWDRLEPLSFADQLRAVAGEEEFHTWGLCRLLQLKSGGVAGEHPAQAGRLAQLAVAVSDRLPAAYDPDWVCDLRALALAYLGNARRLLGEPWGAADALAAARVERQAGTDDPAIEAEILVLEALARRDQGRVSEAGALLQTAHQRFAEAFHGDAGLGSVQLSARAAGAIHLACCLYRDGQPALAILREAAGLAFEEQLADGAGASPDAAGSGLRRESEIWRQFRLAHMAEAAVSLRQAAEAADRLGDAAMGATLRRVLAGIGTGHPRKGLTGAGAGTPSAAPEG
jgi:hypothetical protein